MGIFQIHAVARNQIILGMNEHDEINAEYLKHREKMNKILQLIQLPHSLIYNDDLK